MLNVQLITANVGSLFEDETGVIKEAWVDVICNHLVIRMPDFVAFGLQELGGKSKKMTHLDSISKFIIDKCCGLGYLSYGIVLDRNPSSSNFTATGTVSLSVIYRFIYGDPERMSKFGT